MLVINNSYQIVQEIIRGSVLVAELTDKIIDPNDDILNSAISYNKRNLRRLTRLKQDCLPDRYNENSDMRFYIMAWAKDELKGASQEEFIDFFGCLIYGFFDTGVEINQLQQVAKEVGVDKLILSLSVSERWVWRKLYEGWFDVNFEWSLMEGDL